MKYVYCQFRLLRRPIHVFGTKAEWAPLQLGVRRESRSEGTGDNSEKTRQAYCKTIRSSAEKRKFALRNKFSAYENGRAGEGCGSTLR